MPSVRNGAAVRRDDARGSTAAKMLNAILNLAMAVDAGRQAPVPKPSKPAERHPMGLGLGCQYDMSNYVTEEDINRKIENVMAKVRGEAASGA